MEADWEVEIGQSASFSAPVIDACWSGLIDLRTFPERAPDLPEIATLPALADVLVRLNGSHSPVSTSKCDVWPLTDAEHLDADELDAPAEEATHGWACYLDLAPSASSKSPWITPEAAVQQCQSWCKRLRQMPITHCRADLIVRQAILSRNQTPSQEYAVTAYLTACGKTTEEARATLAQTAKAFADALCLDSTVE